ncbi:MAG: magnesium/cobalt transporter CorA [Cyclobacteriaceae bacterium]|nr:magnesium/cobalt transporter CorA [Cyclobacteriaceae bacterium]
MKKVKLPFLTPKAFANSAKSLVDHLRPSTHKIGLPPGTLTYTGKNKLDTKIRLFQFNQEALLLDKIKSVKELDAKMSDKHISWIDVVGFDNIKLYDELGSYLGIDQLTLEDMLNISQLPKIEDHDDYIFITLKVVDLLPEEHMFSFTHYSLIVKDNMLITFSEKPNPIFQSVEERLQNTASKIRSSSIDYLSYRIIDIIVDHYYNALDWFTNILSDLESELIDNPSKKHINSILTFKKQWLILRKAIIPFKEAMRRLMKTEDSDYIKLVGEHYIGDLVDHLHSIEQTLDILRETLNNLMDLYNSSISNKMNEVMKMLTLVSTIFIPLTFIAGIYGMNFKYMPALDMPNGYYYTLGSMGAIGLVMFIYMKRNRWL